MFPFGRAKYCAAFFVIAISFECSGQNQTSNTSATSKSSTAAASTAGDQSKTTTGDTSNTTSTDATDEVAPTPAKHRAAVMNFNHAKVLSSVQSSFGSEQNLGLYFADLLANRLTADNVMHVIDRGGMNKVLFEPEFPVVANDRPDIGFEPSGGLLNLGVRPAAPPQAVANKVGSVLGMDPVMRYFGADSLITGEFLAFGREDMRQKTIMEQVRSKMMKECRKTHAIATVNVRMIDLSTGDLIASTKLTAISHHTACDMLIARGYTKPVSDINDSTFLLTPLGDALEQVATQAAQLIEHNSPQSPVNRTQVYGAVADVDSSNITVNVGSVGGVHVGDLLVITHLSRTINDPDSNKPMRTIETPVGQITITSVTPFYAIGRFSGGDAGSQRHRAQQSSVTKGANHVLFDAGRCDYSNARAGTQLPPIDPASAD